jgi:hypothetical protein
MLARSIGGPGSDFDGVYAIEFMRIPTIAARQSN